MMAVQVGQLVIRDKLIIGKPRL